MPALLTSTSSLPKRSTAVFTTDSHDDSSASASPCSVRTSAAITFAPSAANRRTSASPWPREPPVTIATLPSSRPTAEPPIWPVTRARSWRCTTGGPLHCEPGDEPSEPSSERTMWRGSLPSTDVPDPTPLSGRVAFVTGASRGIGQAIALALAEAGADVAVADVHPEPFRAERWYRLRQRTSGPEEEVPTAAAVAALGRRSTAIAVDVSDAAAVEG